MKRKRSLKHQPSVKLKRKQTLVYATTGIALAVIAGAVVFLYLNVGTSTSSLAKASKNQGYVSSGQGSWNDDTSWTASEDEMDDTPGADLNYKYVEIYGYINRVGNLTVRGKTHLIIHDTLWITGDLTLSGRGSVTVGDSGILIIDGNYAATGRTTGHNKGQLVVKRNIDASGGTDFINDKGLYVFGTTHREKRATFNGTKDVSNATILSKDTLEINNAELYAFATAGVFKLATVLSYFYAQARGANVIVNWESAAELNNDLFHVERSADGVRFEEIATIPGVGNSQKPTEYSYTDTQPLKGISYYRLSQVDHHGKTEIFNTVAVFLTTASTTDSIPKLSMIFSH
ncbi:hypothetical protein [Tunicatimonas pelagia]|uniref:hypothetical protein n=1 Tax=Tunicatimonas pelagia TaxID=931531 RepID=UPI002666C72D|nr:hypothetical protein [Tunicatimonas pelagia]WKN42841.1 hypothetical protein P0M28_27780 [Tunicatimonas pelagia]